MLSQTDLLKDINHVKQLKDATLSYYNDLVNDLRNSLYQDEDKTGLNNSVATNYHWVGHKLTEEQLDELGSKSEELKNQVNQDKDLPKISRSKPWAKNSYKLYNANQGNTLNMVNGRKLIDQIMVTLVDRDIKKVREIFSDKKNSLVLQSLCSMVPEITLVIEKLNVVSTLLEILDNSELTAKGKISEFSRTLNLKENQQMLLKKRSRAGDIFLAVVLTILAPLGLMVGAYRLWGKVSQGKDFMISIPSAGEQLTSFANSIIKKAEEEKKIVPLSFFNKAVEDKEDAKKGDPDRLDPPRRKSS